jgi:hypothetical protein
LAKCPVCGRLPIEAIDALEYFEDLHGLFSALDNWNRDRTTPTELVNIDLETLECPRCGTRRVSPQVLHTMPRCTCDGAYGPDHVAMQYPKKYAAKLRKSIRSRMRACKPRETEKT